MSSDKIEIKKLPSKLNLDLFKDNWIPVPGQAGIIMCFEGVTRENSCLNTVTIKDHEYTVDGQADCILPLLYQYQSGTFTKIAPNLSPIGYLRRIHSLREEDCDYTITTPHIDPYKFLCIDDQNTFRLLTTSGIWVIQEGQEEIVTNVSPDMYIYSTLSLPIPQLNDSFIICEGMPCYNEKGSKIATIHRDSRTITTKELPIFNKALRPVIITALCPLPNGDLLAGGYDGSISQIRLDDKGDLLKSTFITYLHNLGGHPEPINFITHLPGDNNYLIGGGNLFLAQFKDDKIVLLDEISEWLTYYDTSIHYKGNRIVDICPLASNAAIVFTSYRHGKSCTPNDNHSFFSSRPNIKDSRKGYYPYYVEIKKKKLLFHEVPWFQSLDDSTKVLEHLLLPGGRLLFGGTNNSLFLAWVENNILMHQKITFPGPNIKHQTCDLKIDRIESCHDWGIDKGTNCVEWYKTTKTITDTIKGAAHIKYDYFIGGLVFVKHEENYYQVLVQRNFLRHKDNIKKANSAAYINEDKDLHLKPADSFLLTIKTN